jgi:hypothetical protein
MPVAHIKDAPTLQQLLHYTMTTIPANRRPEFWDRDVLRSKVRIVKKTIYHNIGSKVQFSTRYDIVSYSRPQYGEYLKLRGGNKKNQPINSAREHQYPIIIQFSTNNDGEITLSSKVRWRTGNFKKWNFQPPQSQIKQVYNKTKEKIKQRINSLMRGESDKEINTRIKLEIDKVRKLGKFLSIGDFNAENGVFGDGYFRDYILQYSYNALIGPIWNTTFPDRGIDKNLKFPYLDKHVWGVIKMLISKKIIKITAKPGVGV